MQEILSLLFIITCSTNVLAQNTFKAIIKDEKNHEPLIGVSVLLKGTQNNTTSDDKGFVELKNIPNGKQTIIIKSVGFKENEKSIFFPESATIAESDVEIRKYKA